MAKQTEIGKAFEYACFQAIANKAKAFQVPVNQCRNKPYDEASAFFKGLDGDLQTDLFEGAKASIEFVFSCEPHMSDSNIREDLSLRLQTDAEGQKGDVRDIVLERVDDTSKKRNAWQCGVSCKHNHDAVKHPRVGLNGKSDFLDKWTSGRFKCSEAFFHSLSSISNLLVDNKGGSWESVFPDIDIDLYKPISEAVQKEIKRLQGQPEFVTVLFSYMIGEYDFYKMMAFDKERRTQLSVFNIQGSLNKKTKFKKPERVLKQTPKPRVILAVTEISNSTFQILFDEGWAFSLRIHNASGKIEPSLKYDVRLVGVPFELVNISFPWD